MNINSKQKEKPKSKKKRKHQENNKEKLINRTKKIITKIVSNQKKWKTKIDVKLKNDKKKL